MATLPMAILPMTVVVGGLKSSTLTKKTYLVVSFAREGLSTPKNAPKKKQLYQWLLRQRRWQGWGLGYQLVTKQSRWYRSGGRSLARGEPKLVAAQGWKIQNNGREKLDFFKILIGRSESCHMAHSKCRQLVRQVWST